MEREPSQSPQARWARKIKEGAKATRTIVPKVVIEIRGGYAQVVHRPVGTVVQLIDCDVTGFRVPNGWLGEGEPNPADEAVAGG